MNNITEIRGMSIHSEDSLYEAGSEQNTDFRVQGTGRGESGSPLQTCETWTAHSALLNLRKGPAHHQRKKSTSQL
jgi:hypothetical protein